MNNILSYREYFTNIDPNDLVDEIELNEGTGIRGFFNKLAGRKIKSELSEEIELSKQIMEGIREGLESLNENFDAMKKGIDADKSESSKGEKQKVLDSITKLIEQSRKSTWDINELIDEGEIDYTGFTANVGLSTISLFGVLLCPIRAMVIVHKGYNYFFTTVKNTIRKALVMLQLNFDQFENLIITKSFQSMGYMQTVDTNSKISEFYGQLQSKLFDKKHGMLKGKRGEKYVEEQMRLAKQEIDHKMRAEKQMMQADNAYNCLDQYNNTYTKSLETLRQYTQDDVQKHLDAIKTSINKIAVGDVDLQAYGELVIAAAEEHAYKVSSSIYSKFAKMTEVFSLPNQKKLIDLIQGATKEEQEAAERERKEKMRSDEIKALEEERDRVNEEGLEVFNIVSGVSVGELDKDTNKYSDVDASKWTYEEYKNLDDDKREIFSDWLRIHPEVLEKCDETLRVSLPKDVTDGYFKYIDSLIDYVKPALDVKAVDESFIMSFDEYLINEENGSENNNEGEKKDDEEKKTKKKSETEYYINFKGIEDKVSDDIKKLFVVRDGKKMKEVAEAALDSIGENIIGGRFTGIVGTVVDKIGGALNSKKRKIKISKTTYNILLGGIKKLKEEKSKDYPSLQKDRKKDEN